MTHKEGGSMNNHHHPHDHGHSGCEHSQSMGTVDKLIILADHWLSHNIEHAKTYETWAMQAEKEGLVAVSSVLSEIMEQTKHLNSLFEKVKKELQR